MKAAAAPSIQIQGVSKKYTLRESAAGFSARTLLSSRFGVKKKEFWALKDIDLELKPGQTLGVIGINGSGKSTLLKLMAGVSQPSSGRVTTSGNLVGLLELGAGFHPDLTGFQNIYLQCNLLGMRKSEIDRRLDEIVAFSGLSHCLDWPVRRYSSGMYARLGFSVALFADAQIILIDEILAVGDMDFQRQGIARLNEIKQRGESIIVLVTHDIFAAGDFSSEVLWLDKGRPAAYGNPTAVCQQYWDYVQPQMLAAGGLKNDQHLYEEFSRQESKASPLRITGVHFEDESGNRVEQAVAGQDLHICMDVETSEPIRNPALSLYLIAMRERMLMAEIHSEDLPDGFHIPQGRSTITIQLSPQLLLDGEYAITVLLHRDLERTVALAGVYRQGRVRVVSDPPQLFPNAMTHPHRWNFGDIRLRLVTEK